MKCLITLCSILFSSLLHAQSHRVMDTIYANEHMNVALFFPSSIQQAIAGSTKFVFTYNREKEQHFGLLQATPGPNSNLLVIDSGGAIYSYIITYKRQLTKLTYFISTTESIGNAKGSEQIAQHSISLAIDPGFDKTKYKDFCSELLQQKASSKKLKRRVDGMELRLKKIIFDREELYFVIQIENKSSLDFDINFLHMGIETRKKGQNRSLQYVKQHPLYVHAMPTKITKSNASELVIVVPKFSISKERVVVLTLNERQGERNLKLLIPSKFINHPN